MRARARIPNPKDAMTVCERYPIDHACDPTAQLEAGQIFDMRGPGYVHVKSVSVIFDPLRGLSPVAEGVLLPSRLRVGIGLMLRV